MSTTGAMTAERAEKISLAYLEDVQIRESTRNVSFDGLQVRRVMQDPLGQLHARLTQTFNGVPVFGGEVIVHMDGKGTAVGHTDGTVPKVEVSTVPALAEEQAIEVAVAEAGGWDRVSDLPTAKLQVMRHDGTDHLVYQVQIQQFELGFDPAMPVLFVDAHAGKVVWGYDDLQHVSLSDADKRTYTMNNGTSYTSAVIADSSDNVANQAHVNAGLTLAYFLADHGRDSFNGAGARVDSYVHYSSSYVNAYWNGSVLTYGDGDNVNSGPLVTLDIVAHEFSHGVTDYSADLIYSNESGALNEATSDIFAAAVEAANGGTFTDIWYVGEDTWLADTALRYMDDPARAGDYDYYPTRYTGSSDNGGVHWNSGIANLFFHLLSVGGTHPRGKTSTVVTGIGITNAARIWYRALTVYMTPSTTFADARAATINAANDLNSSWTPSVQAAWDAVGVAAAPTYSVIATHTGLAGATGATATFGPYDASTYNAIRFQMSGGTGDADLYVRFGAAPTTTAYDCRPYTAGNAETCEFNPSQAGLYYVMIRAYSTYSGVTLTVSASGNTPPPAEVCDDNIDNDGDGAVDCADSDCANDPVCAPPPAEICDDNIDNDGDGAVDCADSDCANDPVCAPPPAEICDDNVDNDGDGATDCADSDCANDPVCTGGTWVTISSVDFESGWGPYIDGGNDARRNINDNAYAHSGNYCVRIRDNSSTSVFYTNSSAFNVAGRTQMEIDFWFFPVSFEAGEDFFVEVQAPGGAWTAVGNFVRGVDFNNNAFYNRTVSVDLTALGSPATVGVRFRADASANDDTVHMDDIVIRAR
ncbi:MAG: M4 family metallopeptidase [Deltaproteobacteria bacterium]|nr:M4 family metallopeptidase [Deltaproteobacteria bacterium]